MKPKTIKILCLFGLCLMTEMVFSAEYPSCDNKKVYLKVMEKARALPKPYANWQLKGSAGLKTLRPHQCYMTLLFVTGKKSGKMTEVGIIYKTDVPLANIHIQLTKNRKKECQAIRIPKGRTSTHLIGNIAPNAVQCYHMQTTDQQTAKVSIASNANVVMTIKGIQWIGNAQKEFEFMTTKGAYEVLVFQLPVSNEPNAYQLRVEIK
ncbi:MAG: hypothetical protein KAG10_01640 [Methylococcales bacterium]|nr:hypothetical protein [Methylococcales bacterium]MCK5924576.1 hypothetical protein [Methylococcales bacterium]